MSPGSPEQHRGATATSDAPDSSQITEVIDLVKTYVRQETIGPLKGIGRKIGVGLAGAGMLGLGVFFLALGLLRLIQTQVPRLSRGTLSLVPYVIVLVFCAAVTGIAAWRITKVEEELN